MHCSFMYASVFLLLGVGKLGQHCFALSVLTFLECRKPYPAISDKASDNDFKHQDRCSCVTLRCSFSVGSREKCSAVAG